jgi:hypothetical protein
VSLFVPAEWDASINCAPGAVSIMTSSSTANSPAESPFPYCAADDRGRSEEASAQRRCRAHESPSGHVLAGPTVGSSRDR